jgi:hypothetical protein
VNLADAEEDEVAHVAAFDDMEGVDTAFPADGDVPEIEIDHDPIPQARPSGVEDNTFGGFAGVEVAEDDGEEGGEGGEAADNRLTERTKKAIVKLQQEFAALPSARQPLSYQKIMQVCVSVLICVSVRVRVLRMSVSVSESVSVSVPVPVSGVCWRLTTRRCSPCPRRPSRRGPRRLSPSSSSSTSMPRASSSSISLLPTLISPSRPRSSCIASGRERLVRGLWEDGRVAVEGAEEEHWCHATGVHG